VEARIKPADIGFVRVGQHAEVKLSAFEYNLYGGLSGRVERISPDALGDADKPPGSGEATWFRAIVSIDHSTLRAQGQALPVLPGMTGTVEINTGERSVLDYVLRPLLKAREAFTER
jgi:adhesin transport system membrane fusion protein